MRCFNIKKVKLLLAMLIVFSFTRAFAADGDYRHWAEPLIDKTFYSDYLYDYSGSLTLDLLDRQMEERLYQKAMRDMLFSLTKKDVESETNRIDRDKDVEIISIWENDLTRKVLALETIDILKEFDIEMEKGSDSKLFIDLESLSEDEKEAVDILSSIGVIKGYSESEFRPDQKVSYAQGIIVLQRIRDIIEKNIELEEQAEKEAANKAAKEKEAEEKADAKVDDSDENIGKDKDGKKEELEDSKEKDIDKTKNDTQIGKQKEDKISRGISYSVYSGNAFSEGIFSKANKDKETGNIELEITIAKYFPSDDYHLKVKDVVRTGSGKYKIIMHIEEPKLKDLTIEDSVLDAITIKIGGSAIAEDAESGSMFSFSVDFGESADN